MQEIIAQCTDISYKYPNSEGFVLGDVNLELYKGEFLGLIGPTGAGKTTLSMAFTGIVPQFYGGQFFGSLKVAGLDTLEHPISVLSQHVGTVFEDPESQITSTSVENEIAFALENLKVPREEIRRRIPGVLEAVRLEGTEEKHPHELSGGQKQRLAIAAALALQPDLMVLDEPTSQLDPVGAKEVFRTVRELNKDMGVTILMVSHAAEEMAEFSDRIVLLSGGRIIKKGTPEEIYADIALLAEHYLRPPQVSQSFSYIRDRGIDVPNIPVKLEPGISLMTDLGAQYGPTVPRPTDHTEGQAVEPDVKWKDKELLIRLREMKHVYGDGTEALHGVNLDIYRGEYLLIIGQNGAGKSTMVKHFLKLLEPTSGVVEVGGKDSTKLSMSDLARHIGYVAQNPDNQIFNSSVEAEVSFALKNLGFPKETVEQRTTESLDSMGLLEERHTHPLALPKGDRARVVIAAILAMYPDTIIFDEPTTGQDYRGAKYILDISRRLHEMGKTVIVITHHLYLMPDYAKRVVVMGKGTILLDAHIRDAYHDTETLEKTYLTAPQAVTLANSLAGSEIKSGKFKKLLTPAELAECFSPSAVNVSAQGGV
ncbi:MAG: ABC transporter ATP-binding protein [Spirochaetaceae bacterium]